MGLKSLFSFKNVVLGLLFSVVVGLVVIPSILLIIGSFIKGNPYDANLVLTLDNYRQLFQEGIDILTLLGHSFWLAVWATSLSVILGCVFAWIITRTDVPLTGLLSQLMMIPFYFSPFLGGICWSLLAAGG